MFYQAVRQHTLLTAVGIVITLVLLALISVIQFSEPLFRSLVEGKGSAILGRDLTIDGPLDVDWHWTYTAVHARNIRLANAPDYPEPEMLTLETLHFTFKPAKLLLGKLELGVITIHKPHLFLNRKTPDDANWNFPALAQKTKGEEPALARDRQDIPIFGNLTIHEGQVMYRDAVKGLELDLDLDTVIGQGGEQNNQDERGFTIKGTGSIQEKTFALEASGDSLESLRDSTREFPLRLHVIMGSTEIFVDGSFQDPIKFTGVNAALKIAGDNMANLYYLTAIPLPPTPPYTLEGQLTKKNGVWGYQDFKGKVGSSDLAGQVSYDTRGERGFLTAELQSELLNSEDLGGFIGLAPEGENATPEQKAAAAEKKASPKLIPDVPLQVERLRTTDLDVRLNAKKIVAPSLPFKGMEVRFDLRNGVLILDPFNLTLADGTLDGKIEINAREDIPPMKMDLNLRKLSLGQFFANTRFAKSTAGVFGGRVALSGTGSSLAQVLATSNGKLSIIMTGGKISLLLIEASDLDLAQALPLFLGEDKSTKIRCGLVDFDIDNGLLTSDIMVLDTADSLLQGDIEIDMKKEVINAKLDVQPKDNSLFSAQSPITLKGKLKTPAIGIDAKKAGTRGLAAVALGSLLTPFAALIPFIETGEEKNADCRALINAAKN